MKRVFANARDCWPENEWIEEEVMAKGRIVYRNEQGGWVNKRLGSERAGSVHNTQHAAEDAARRMLRDSGGGELITKGEDGRIRSKDTIPPAQDPNPPKDREH